MRYLPAGKKMKNNFWFGMTGLSSAGMKSMKASFDAILKVAIATPA